jgi:hypothetical protein
MFESHILKRLRFIFSGQDYQEKIRKEVAELKIKYQGLFREGVIIPEMNCRGKLIFSKDDEESDD